MSNSLPNKFYKLQIGIHKELATRIFNSIINIYCEILMLLYGKLSKNGLDYDNY